MSTLTQLVPMPRPETVNGKASPCPTSFLIRKYGMPRSEMTQECLPPTSLFWKSRIVTKPVHPKLRATGHRLAVELLERTLEDVKAKFPELYKALGSAGMLCCRLVRGSKHTPSNHSLGLAIDFTIDGVLDRRGDDMVQRGLLDLYSVFKRHGWYWGVEFGTEDAMHFEVSAETVMKWVRSGEF